MGNRDAAEQAVAPAGHGRRRASTPRIQRLSGAGLVFYALAVTFAGIDWIMSLNPHWYSTLFGFLMMGGQGLAALAFTIVVSTFLVKREPMSGLLKPNHFHDLGKLMFAFVMLWAYFNFSQFLLTYAANLVEEIPVHDHAHQQRLAVSGALPDDVPLLRALAAAPVARPEAHAAPAGHDRRLAAVRALRRPLHDGVARVRRRAARTCTCCAGEHVSHFFVHWLDLAAPLAIGGLWFWMFLGELRQRPMLAIGDPYLRESLETAGGGH